MMENENLTLTLKYQLKEDVENKELIQFLEKEKAIEVGTVFWSK